MKCPFFSKQFLTIFVLAFVVVAWPTGASAELTYTTSVLGITITGSNPQASGSLIIPDTIDGLPVTGIYSGAFQDCTGLTNLWISTNVTRISGSAFQGCTGLTGVMIPMNVSVIGGNAFGNCTSLTNFFLDPFNPSFSSMDGILYDEAFTTLYLYPSGRKGPFAMLSNVTSIANFAFSGCEGLTSMSLHPGVLNLGSGTFAGCGALTNVNIPSGVTYLGLSLFSSCDDLRTLTVPASVTNIYSYSFSYCTNLTSVYFLGDKPRNSTGIFSGADLATVYYVQGRQGWDGDLWAGRPTATWVPPPVLPPVVSFGTNVLILEVSSSLTNSSWIPLATNNISTDLPQRFYRLRIQ